MCGICGFYGFENKDLLKRMTSILKHRGPDDSGYFTDKNVSLGHRRLSIIDLKTGHQPMFNEDGLISIVFNGEIYNYKEIRKDLEKRGHRFATDSDTETIIHAYEEHYHKCLEKLRGMFAFAIWDSSRKQLFLARDHVGIKPLYYHYDGERFFFASEIKSLLEAGIRKNIDMESLEDYLTFGFVRGDKTIYEGIKKLLPGHCMTYDGTQLLQRRYWNFRVLGIDKDFATAEADFREIFRDSVKLRMISDVPLGAFLSGGVDSSAVVAYMSQLSKEPVKTFSVGFGQENDELEYARFVSEQFGTDHTEKVVEYKDMPGLIEKLVWHADDPMSDAALLPTYMMSQVAAEKVKVVLTGEGADELFGGYVRYGYFSGKYRFAPEAVRSRMYMYQMTLFRDKEKKQLLESAAMTIPTIGNLNEAIDFELRNSIPDQLLVKVDRASMASSLEARVPFLDTEMIRLGSRLHPDLKMKDGIGKIFMKRALESELPRNIIYRKKHGFSVPLNTWFREDLKDYASRVLLDSETNKKMGFNEEYIRKILPTKQGFKRTGDAFRVWRLLVLNAWQEKFMSDAL